MSSALIVVGIAVAGIFTLGLGIVHLWIPRIFRFDEAIGSDTDATLPPLGTVAAGPWRYPRRRADARGLAWVMSDAASYVLVSIGLLDLAWVGGWTVVPLAIGAWWIAGWWAIRAGSQLVIGRRRIDWLFAGWFAALAVVHVALAAFS
jgi:hypothetical protein